jgi:hypothetical protein
MLDGAACGNYLPDLFVFAVVRFGLGLSDFFPGLDEFSVKGRFRSLGKQETSRSGCMRRRVAHGCLQSSAKRPAYLKDLIYAFRLDKQARNFQNSASLNGSELGGRHFPR